MILVGVLLVDEIAAYDDPDHREHRTEAAEFCCEHTFSVCAERGCGEKPARRARLNRQLRLWIVHALAPCAGRSDARLTLAPPLDRPLCSLEAQRNARQNDTTGIQTRAAPCGHIRLWMWSNFSASTSGDTGSLGV